MIMARHFFLIVIIFGGCAVKPNLAYQAKMDMTPLGCGYKWFQAGYSEAQEFDCNLSRISIRENELQLANENAWDVARARCPQECKPVEIQDSVETVERFPDGVCRNNVLYFSTRVFFSCEK
jgi:hypothetical protein